MKNLIKLNFKTAYRNKGVLIMNFGFLPIMLLFGTILILFSNRGAIGDLLSLRTLATFYLYSSPMFILMASAVTSVYVFKMPQTEGLTYVLYSKPISRSQIFWSAFISSILINLINNIIVALFLTISESIFVSVIYWKSATISFIFKILLLHIVYILSAFLLCTLSTSFISLIFSKISAKGLYGITMSIFGLAPLVFGVSRLFSSYVEYSKISPVSKLNNIKRENLEPDIQTSFIKEDYALSNKKLSNNNLKIQGISNILNINSWIVNLYDDIVLMNEKQTGIDAMLGKSKIYNYYFYKKDLKTVLDGFNYLTKDNKKIYIINTNIASTAENGRQIISKWSLNKAVTEMSYKRNFIKWGDKYYDRIKYPYSLINIWNEHPNVFDQQLFDQINLKIQEFRSEFNQKISDRKAELENVRNTFDAYDNIIKEMNKKIYNSIFPLIANQFKFYLSAGDKSDEEQKFNNFIEQNKTYERRDILGQKLDIIDFDFQDITKGIFLATLIDNNMFEITKAFSLFTYDLYNKTKVALKDFSYADPENSKLFGALFVNSEHIDENKIDVHAYKVHMVSIFPAYLQFLIIITLAGILSTWGWAIYRKANLIK